MPDGSSSEELSSLIELAASAKHRAASKSAILSPKGVQSLLSRRKGCIKVTMQPSSSRALARLSTRAAGVALKRSPKLSRRLATAVDPAPKVRLCSFSSDFYTILTMSRTQQNSIKCPFCQMAFVWLRRLSQDLSLASGYMLMLGRDMKARS